jgi:hypothetical protein
MRYSRSITACVVFARLHAKMNGIVIVMARAGSVMRYLRENDLGANWFRGGEGDMRR